MLFIVFTLASFGWFIVADTSLVWAYDGWTQHFKALVYFAQYLRSIARHLLFDHQLIVPNWEFYLSEGADIVSTLHYYAIGEPLNLLAALVPTRYMHYFYSFLCIFRLYLAGLVFSALCFETGQKCRLGVLVAAMSYCFCMWSLLCAARHPFFLTPMIYFPLMILGMERIINGKPPYVFITATVLSSVSQFYFFYMIVILSIAYALVRLVVRNRHDFKSTLKTLAYMLGMAIIGTLIAGILLLPILMTFTNDSRIGVSMSTQWLYPLSHYLKLPSVFASNNNSYWLQGGFTAPILLAIPLLFSDRRNNRTLKVLLVICLLITLFPMAGRFLNGMSYTANRWCWALALLLAYILVVEWPRLLALNNKEYRTLILFCGFYFITCTIFLESRTIASFMTIGLMMLTVLLLNNRPQVAIKKLSLVLVTLVCVFTTSAWMLSPDGDFYLAQFKKNKNILEEWSWNEATLIAEESDETYPRYSGREATENGSLVGKTSGTAFYWSLSNPYIAEYRNDIATSELMPHAFKGYDDRTTLLALAAVEYYTVKDSDTQGIPYGFIKTDMAEGWSYSVWKNKNALPLGYCYDRIVTLDEWNSMNPVQRQEIQLTAALVDRPTKGIATSQTNRHTYETTYTLEIQDDNVFEINDGLLVTSNDATIELILDSSIGNAETYVGFSGFKYETWPEYDLFFGNDGVDPNNTWDKSSFEELDVDRKLSVIREKLRWDPVKDVRISLESTAGRATSIKYLQPESSFSNGRNNFIANLGYSKKPSPRITITFPQRGLYTWDSLAAYQVSMEGFEENIAALAQNHLENVELSTDSVAGTLTLDKQKLLCLAIPYSKGWRAYIDDMEVDALCVNKHYVGMCVPAGNHKIGIRYSSPYKIEGFILTCVGFILLGILVLFRRKRSQKGTTQPMRFIKEEMAN